MELLAHLESLAAVVEEQGFTRAAERLGIPQPLISRRIQNLERLWGQTLLDRSSRRIVPTPFTQSVLPQVHDLLVRAERLDVAVAAARAGVIRVIGVPSDCPAPALAELLRVGREHGVTLAIAEMTARLRQDAVASGELGYGLIRVPPESAWLRVPLGLAVSRARARPREGWDLDALRPRRGAPAPSGDAGPELFVTAEDDTDQALECLRGAVSRAGLAPTRVRVGALSACAAQVLAGDGVLICDRAAAGRQGLAWDPLTDRTLDRGYVLRSSPAAGESAHEWMAAPLARILPGAVDASGAGEPGGVPVSGPATRGAALRLAATG